MTEDGLDWFKRTCLYARYVPNGAQSTEVAEFWTSVFCHTVEHRATLRCKHAIHPPCFGCLGIAFMELKNDTRKMP